ncbi:MAG: hypothetical protein K6G45_03930 [Lachnospiraceae bacterium]|nr:hypothetical protein [Lachnospiraceae bacterium]MCR5767624.1 hypothetical protein [Lachnospiraceae bacterium]
MEKETTNRKSEKEKGRKAFKRFGSRGKVKTKKEWGKDYGRDQGKGT